MSGLGEDAQCPALLLTSICCHSRRVFNAQVSIPNCTRSINTNHIIHHGLLRSGLTMQALAEPAATQKAAESKLRGGPAQVHALALSAENLWTSSTCNVVILLS